MNAAEFFTWWRQQLLSLVPDSLRRGLRNNGHDLALKLDGDTLKVSRNDSTDELSLELSAPADTDTSQLLPGDVEVVRMTLAAREFLVRRFTLPQVARGNLVEAVGYQIPKLVPFSRDQVLFACGIDPARPSDRELRVWLIAIPRRRIAAALAPLGLAPPAGPLSVRSAPERADPLVFSWRLAEGGEVKARRQRWALAGLAAVWAIAIGVTGYNQQRDYNKLTADLAALRQEARAIGALREQLDNTRAQLGELIERRRTSVSPLQVLNVLTRELADDTWVVNLDLEGPELAMQGVSPAPAALIETLEETALLSNVRFDAAITQSGRGEGSRFNISATVTPDAEAIP